MNRLSKVYGLEQISNENWEDYYNDMYTYLSEPNKVEWYTEDNDEFIKLSSFFDIYENSFKNADIANATSSVSATNSINTSNITKSNCNYYNKQSAIAYAKKPNPDYSYISGHDCTNFISQILVTGGKNMNYNWRTYKRAMFFGNILLH